MSCQIQQYLQSRISNRGTQIDDVSQCSHTGDRPINRTGSASCISGESMHLRVYIFGYPSNAEQHIRRQFRQVKQELDQSGIIAADTAGSCRQNPTKPCIVRRLYRQVRKDARENSVMVRRLTAVPAFSSASFPLNHSSFNQTEASFML